MIRKDPKTMMSRNPVRPMPGKMAMKKGGRACMAMGGPAKQRKGEMSASGAPKAPKTRFKGGVI
jgi:hypothetical protein